MSFCPRDRCINYSQAATVPRKCYYEPQCWRGLLDQLINLILSIFGRTTERW